MPGRFGAGWRDPAFHGAPFRYRGNVVERPRQFYRLAKQTVVAAKVCPRRPAGDSLCAMRLVHHDAEIAAWTAEYSSNVQLAYVLCDRWKDSERAALIWESGGSECVELSFADVASLSSRVAGRLGEIGIGKGDVVAGLLPRCPALMTLAVAVWRRGATFLPLFTAFGPEAIRYRVEHSGAALVVAHKRFTHNVAELPYRSEIVDDFATALTAATPQRDAAAYRTEDPIGLIYTSGTTGQPKGVALPARALASIRSYMTHGLDVQQNDTYWNLGDPGWAYGFYYSLIGPLLLGHPTLWVDAPFGADRVADVVKRWRVTNIAMAPSAWRALRAASFQAPRDAIRVATSAGEPLPAALLNWSRETLGVPIHDQYGQTEIGMVVMNAHSDGAEPAADSMGRPAPGYRVVLLSAEGEELDSGRRGEIALDVPASRLYWFQGYFRQGTRSTDRFPFGERYYVTGDYASRDENGNFHMEGRTDDLIKSSGYRIGPYEIESVLTAHPEVAEAAVVGHADEERGQLICAFVVPRSAVSDPVGLSAELQQWVRVRLAAHMCPKRVIFVSELPKTPTGKVQRYRLRAHA